MTAINKGTIIDVQGSWGSGLANLLLKDEVNGELIHVPADNGPLIRALEAAFGEVIQPGHIFNVAAIKGKSIYWSYDEFGLTLGGFTPAEEASPELEAAYQNN